MPEGEDKTTSKSWKVKALERNKELHKRIKELSKSRDLWKHKYQALRSEVGYGSLSLRGSKAKHHSYSTFLVWFCVQAQSYGRMSLRGCVQVLLCLGLVSGRLGGKGVPNYGSIHNWVCKAGYYCLHHEGNSSESLGLYCR